MTGNPITAVHVGYDVVHIKYTKHELYLWELVLLKDLQTAQVIHMETPGGLQDLFMGKVLRVLHQSKSRTEKNYTNRTNLCFYTMHITVITVCISVRYVKPLLLIYILRFKQESVHILCNKLIHLIRCFF